MNSPARADTQLIYGGKSYLAAVHLADDIVPFVAIGRGPCTRAAFRCPSFIRPISMQGFLICEDLGSEGVLTGTPPAPIEERYHAATDVLVVLHKDALPTRTCRSKAGRTTPSLRSTPMPC